MSCMLPFILIPFSFSQPSTSHICAFIQALIHITSNHNAQAILHRSPYHFFYVFSLQDVFYFSYSFPIHIDTSKKTFKLVITLPNPHKAYIFQLASYFLTSNISLFHPIFHIQSFRSSTQEFFFCWSDQCSFIPYRCNHLHYLKTKLQKIY